MRKKILTVLALLIIIVGVATFFFLSKEQEQAVDNEKEVEQAVENNKDVREVENEVEQEVVKNDPEIEGKEGFVGKDYETARLEAIKGHEMSDAKMEAISTKAFLFLLEGYTDKTLAGDADKTLAGDADKIFEKFKPYILFSDESMKRIVQSQFLPANLPDSYIEFEYQGYARQENATRLLVYYDITKDDVFKKSGEFIDVIGLSQIEMVLEVDGDEFKYLSLSFR